MNTKVIHLNSLDFIKICATYAIVFHHYQEFLQVKFPHINFFYGVFPFHSMVYLFFTISGFFMVKYIHSIMKGQETFGEFIKRRAIRLLPMTAITAVVYELVLVAFIILTGTSFNKVTSDMGISNAGVLSGFSVLLTMTGTGSGWFWKGPMANEVTWYICVLLLCYVIFYICCKTAARFKFNVNYAFVGMVITGLSCASYGLSMPFLNANSFQGYIPFFIGVMLGEFLEKRNYTSEGIVLALGWIGCAISSIYVIGVFAFAHTAFTDEYWLMFITFPSMIIVFLSKRMKSIFFAGIWQKWGGITFDIYVWHFILIIILMSLKMSVMSDLPINSRWFMIVIAMVVTFIGTISYYFIEKRMQKLVADIVNRIRATGNN